MAKANLGTKRVCPETGRKFYDLEKDPIVSPYTGKEYDLSFFEGTDNITAAKPDEATSEGDVKTQEAASSDEEIETDDEDEDGPEIISLEDAEDSDDDSDDDLPDDIPDDIPDVELDDDDDSEDGDDTFLEEDDEDDDISDVIVTPTSDDDDV